MNEYRVYVNGTELKYRNANKNPCLRKALLLAKNKNLYVELVYVHGNGLVIVCDCWN